MFGPRLLQLWLSFILCMPKPSHYDEAANAKFALQTFRRINPTAGLSALLPLT